MKHVSLDFDDNIGRWRITIDGEIRAIMDHWDSVVDFLRAAGVVSWSQPKWA